MELTQDDVIRILKLIDESPMGRVSLQIGELKLEVTKGTGRGAASMITPASPQPAVGAEAKPAEKAPAAVQAPAAEKAGGSGFVAQENLTAVKAPLLGIFYRRPAPGAPPFVEEGSLVEENTTIALIEVMKLFTPIKAGVKGRIRRICAENNDLVEYDQVLFLVEPE